MHWNTVARAYRRLDDEGLITVRHGRKAVVLRRSPGPKPGARESLRTDLVETLTIGRLRGLSRRDLSAVFNEVLQRLHAEGKSS